MAKNGLKSAKMRTSPKRLITKYIEVYPADWKGKYEDWPRCRIHFKYGRLVDYDDITGQ